MGVGYVNEMKRESALALSFCVYECLQMKWITMLFLHCGNKEVRRGDYDRGIKACTWLVIAFFGLNKEKLEGIHGKTCYQGDN